MSTLPPKKAEKTNSPKIKWGQILRWSIWLIVVIIVAHKWQSAAPIVLTATPKHFLPIGIVLLLMPINLFIETVKWKVLVKPIIPISIKQAGKSVFSGMAFTAFTGGVPGQFIGRLLHFNAKKRVKITGAMAANSWSQTGITLLTGSLALLLLLGFKAWWIPIFTGLSFLLISITGWYGLRWLFSKNFLKSYFEVIFQYSITTWSLSIGLSILRHLIFSFQFLLLLIVFSNHTDWASIFEFTQGIQLTFAAKSFLPSLHILGDLGIRELTALQFLSSEYISDRALISASMILWTINRLLPMLLGSFLIKIPEEKITWVSNLKKKLLRKEF